MGIDSRALKIVQYPAPILRRRADPIERIDDEVRAVAERMLDLMHEAEGAGLAAPQVGVPWRMFVTSPQSPDEADRVFINPELRVENAESSTREEGCLSIPGIYVDIRRPVAVTIAARSLDDEPFELTSDGFEACVWQHENDHLDGVLIIDRMSPMARLATRKALKELRAAAEA